MVRTDSLPFRIRVPGYDSFGAQGILSIAFKLEGLLSFVEKTVILEWAATREVDSVSFSGITSEIDESPVGRCEIPITQIRESRLRGGWWSPNLELRARTLDAFSEIPTARNGIAKLKIRRRDRDHAKAICEAIAYARSLSAGES